MFSPGLQQWPVFSGGLLLLLFHSTVAFLVLTCPWERERERQRQRQRETIQRNNSVSMLSRHLSASCWKWFKLYCWKQAVLCDRCPPICSVLTLYTWWQEITVLWLDEQQFSSPVTYKALYKFYYCQVKSDVIFLGVNSYNTLSKTYLYSTFS